MADGVMAEIVGNYENVQKKRYSGGSGVVL
jgi:hypothetical protein